MYSVPPGARWRATSDSVSEQSSVTTTKLPVSMELRGRRHDTAASPATNAEPSSSAPPRIRASSNGKRADDGSSTTQSSRVLRSDTAPPGQGVANDGAPQGCRPSEIQAAAPTRSAQNVASQPCGSHQHRSCAQPEKLAVRMVAAGVPGEAAEHLPLHRGVVCRRAGRSDVADRRGRHIPRHHTPIEESSTEVDLFVVHEVVRVE